MKREVVKALAEWEYSTPETDLTNHWTKEPLSIRATGPEMLGHIAPTANWAVEIYPLEEWPFFNEPSNEIYRFHMENSDVARRTVLALILAESGVNLNGPA